MAPRKLVDVDDDECLELKINEKYAAKYADRKEKEELNELKNDVGDLTEESSSDEEPEDETGELLNPEIAGQVMSTISAIRNKASVIYDSNRKFFDENDIARHRKEWKKRKRELKQREKSALTLRDYHRMRVAGEIEESSSDDEDHSGKLQEASGPMLSYDEEQEKARRELSAMFRDDSADQDELLMVKKKSQAQIDEENEEYRKFLLDKIAEGGGGIESWQGLNGTEKNDPDEEFLLKYVLNRGWIERQPNVGAIHDTDSESNYSEVEEFERKHNFRFEEPDGGKIITHSRNIEGLVRRKDERRINKRKRKAEGKKKELSKKSEDLKRYKSLKKKEIIKRLKLVQKFTDIPLETLNKLNLECDFDAEEFDRQMASVFNEEFYSKKEKLDTEENEFVNSIINKDSVTPHDEPPAPSSKRKKKEKSAKRLKASDLSKYSFKDAVDELLGMDYEGVAAGQTTRFKYVRTTPASFGITIDEILETDEKLLNRVVSIKKLAPYRNPKDIEKENKKAAKKLLYLKKKKFNMSSLTKK